MLKRLAAFIAGTHLPVAIFESCHRRRHDSVKQTKQINKQSNIHPLSCISGKDFLQLFKFSLQWLNHPLRLHEFHQQIIIGQFLKNAHRRIAGMGAHHIPVVFRNGGKAAEAHLPGNGVEDAVHCPAQAFSFVRCINQPAYKAFFVPETAQEEIACQPAAVEHAHHQEGRVCINCFQLFPAEPVRFKKGYPLQADFPKAFQAPANRFSPVA
jgi:hypothetical protein